jgi:hypothetical protein
MWSSRLLSHGAAPGAMRGAEGAYQKKIRESRNLLNRSASIPLLVSSTASPVAARRLLRGCAPGDLLEVFFIEVYPCFHNRSHPQ